MSESGSDEIWLPYEFEWHEEEETFNDILGENNNLVGEDKIEDALFSLEKEGLVQGIHDPNAQSRWVITDNGIIFVSQQIESHDSLSAKFSRLGNPWMREVLRNLNVNDLSKAKDTKPVDGAQSFDPVDDGINSNDIEIPTEPDGAEQYTNVNLVPASDRVVQLNHNSPEYKEAVNAVDAVIKDVIGDNEFGNEFPEEREAVINTLKAGRKLLDAENVRPIALDHTLLPVLQYIADNFAKGAIAALGAVAVAAVMVLLQ